MPLVVAEADPNDKNQVWMNKLVGKTIHDEETSETTFSKKDLPEEHRIIAPNTITTRDFRMNRLNVHVGDDGVVTHVTHG